MNKLKIMDILDKDKDMKYLYDEIRKYAGSYKVFTNDNTHLEKGSTSLYFIKEYVNLFIKYLKDADNYTDTEIVGILKNILFGYVVLCMVYETLINYSDISVVATDENFNNLNNNTHLGYSTVLNITNTNINKLGASLYFKMTKKDQDTEIKICITVDEIHDGGMFFTFENRSATEKSRYGARKWGIRLEADEIASDKIIKYIEDTYNM